MPGVRAATFVKASVKYLWANNDFKRQFRMLPYDSLQPIPRKNRRQNGAVPLNSCGEKEEEHKFSIHGIVT